MKRDAGIRAGFLPRSHGSRAVIGKFRFGIVVKEIRILFNRPGARQARLARILTSVLSVPERAAKQIARRRI